MDYIFPDIYAHFKFDLCVYDRYPCRCLPISFCHNVNIVNHVYVLPQYQQCYVQKQINNHDLTSGSLLRSVNGS